MGGRVAAGTVYAGSFDWHLAVRVVSRLHALDYHSPSNSSLLFLVFLAMRSLQAEAVAAVSISTERLQPLSPALLEWFASRGISAATLARNGVMMERRYSRALGAETDFIAFPYRQVVAWCRGSGDLLLVWS